jgi:integrase
VAGKQGNGEGTIRRRADGRWEARVVLAGGTRKSIYGKTRQQVARVLAATIRDRDAGLTVYTERQTVDQYLASWLASKKHAVEPSSHLRYEREVRLRLVPALGKTQLSKVSAQQVQALCAQELDRGLSTTSVRKMHAVLHDALDDAVRLGLLHRNVSSLIVLPAVRQHEMTPLTEEQARALLSAAHGDRFEALFTLALATGMRRGELLALKWRDLNLEASVLHVRANLQYSATGWAIAKPKTARSRRSIALSPNVTDALQRHRVRQLQERARLGDAWEDLDLIFPRRDGRFMWPYSLLQGTFYPLLKRAGLPHIRFHDMRHTAATLLLARGVNPKVVSEMLGHANITITLHLYGHVLPHMQAHAAAVMDAMLWTPPHG